MSKHTSQIGIVGLAAMGSNLARNFVNKGVSVTVYNRTTEVTDQFIEEYPSNLITATKTLESFVNSLERPRKILVLIKTGDPIDMLITNLTPLLEPGDIIIDMGNSNFHDTNRRFRLLESNGIKFFGCGISGGEKGALEGPSLMPGGSKNDWQHLQPLFETIAAKDFSGNPCVTYIGPESSGHYVKMVHNGIEYGIMQAMAESYQLLRDGYKLDTKRIAEIFAEFNNGLLNSFLMETATLVLSAEDPEQPGTSLVDKILDTAAQKGTGNWTALESLTLGVASPSIAEAVFSRVISGKKDEREKIDNKIKSDINPAQISDEAINQIESALYFSMIVLFIQGYELIKEASKTYNWNLNLAEISRIWQGGCIIRAKVLSIFTELLSKSNDLLENETILSVLKEHEDNTRKTISSAVATKVPTSVLSSVLAYFDSYTQGRGSANFIQGLRDAFGAHTFQRIDKDGNFHHEWL